MTPPIVALIPARGGSTRIPRKNLAELQGRPLLAWAILAARQSGIFDRHVYVSTEDDAIAAVAMDYGATVIARPVEYATDLAPDIGWVSHALDHLRWRGMTPEAFALLRPTAPFRSARTIRQAWDHLRHHGPYAVDSLRAVEKPKQHPFKMWQPAGELIVPFADTVAAVDAAPRLAPVHSQPTQLLPTVYAQNAALEMAWTRVAASREDATMRPLQMPSISGTRVLPWTMPRYEGLDINQPDDLDYARWLLQSGRVTLSEDVDAARAS